VLIDRDMKIYIIKPDADNFARPAYQPSGFPLTNTTTRNNTSMLEVFDGPYGPEHLLGLDVDNSGTLDPASLDRITEPERTGAERTGSAMGLGGGEFPLASRP